MPTAIEWTEETWNPVVGCSKVSPGCANCYAETIARRFPKRYADPFKPWTPEHAAHNVVLKPERLEQPLRWRRPRLVFVNSMSDLFHEQVPDHYIAGVFAIMSQASQHTFQVLTKRPERARDLLTKHGWPADGYPNVWLGVSIENARHTYRAHVLRQIPAAVRFISAEPLLGSLYEYGDTQAERAAIYERYGSAVGIRRDLNVNVGRAPLDLTGIDWIIVGGESGPGARPMHPDWAREIRDACLDLGCRACRGGERPCVGDYACAGDDERPAYFFKQWGVWAPGLHGPAFDAVVSAHRRDRELPHRVARAGGPIIDGDATLGTLDTVLWRVGKKAAGRELDGRTWNETPTREETA